MFLMVNCGVPFEVRAEFLNTIYTNFTFKGLNTGKNIVLLKLLYRPIGLYRASAFEAGSVCSLLTLTKTESDLYVYGCLGVCLVYARCTPSIQNTATVLSLHHN
jgi:hypothetical protein